MSIVINITYRSDDTDTYTIKCKLSENDLKKPIIDYLLANNIKRACWTIDGKWINVWSTFFNPNKELIGFDFHVRNNCDQYNCDLVIFYDMRSTLLNRLDNRFTTFDFKFVVSNHCESFRMTVPVIATRNIILQL